MDYTTISISKDLKNEVLLLKIINKKSTLEDLIKEMCIIYKKSKEKEV